MTPDSTPPTARKVQPDPTQLVLSTEDEVGAKFEGSEFNKGQKLESVEEDLPTASPVKDLVESVEVTSAGSCHDKPVSEDLPLPLTDDEKMKERLNNELNVGGSINNESPVSGEDVQITITKDPGDSAVPSESSSASQSPSSKAESERGSGRDSGLGESDEASRATTCSSATSNNQNKEFTAQISSDSGVISQAGSTESSSATDVKEKGVALLPEKQMSDPLIDDDEYGDTELKRGDSCSNSPVYSITHEKPLKSFSLSSMPQDSPSLDPKCEGLSMDDIDAMVDGDMQDPDGNYLPGVIDTSADVSHIELELDTPGSSPIKPVRPCRTSQHVRV